VEGKIVVTTHGGRLYGGRTYELGQVTVSLFPLSQLTEHLRERSAQAKREFAELTRAIEEAVAERGPPPNNQESEARDQWNRNRADPHLKHLYDEAISATRSAEDVCAELLRKSSQFLRWRLFF